MRLWDVTGPDVDAADAEPWDMPLASTVRQLGLGSLAKVFVAGALLYLLTGFGSVGLALGAEASIRHPTAFSGFIVLAFTLPTAMLSIGSALSPRTFRRATPVLALSLLLVTPLLATWGVVAAGPALSIMALNYLQAPIFAFYVLRRPWAVLCTGCVLLCFLVVVLSQEGWEFGVWPWLVAMGMGTSVIIGVIAGRSEELATAEHAARMEVAELNKTLEMRVTDQVGEIESLGALRRFLSPQVADAVLSGESDEVTRPHRRRIAVFFCDLRGFTAFTNNAEPEEVVAVLDDYYRAVGGLLQQYDATVGDYAGDGVMAYFGDPVPREDAALAALEMTRELIDVMAPVVAKWRKHGYDLGYGVGLSYGYATLGVIGFDGRYDYKPVGGVVNLAARLCSRADSGQALLDHATHVATEERYPSTHVADFDLKGYGAPIRAYELSPPEA